MTSYIGTMKNRAERNHQKLPLQSPEPTLEQCSIFTTWYAARFGVILDPNEASARLRHITGLFLLLGGAEWIKQRHHTRGANDSQTSPDPPNS